MKVQPNSTADSYLYSQNLILEVIEPKKEEDSIEILVTSVDVRLLSSIISKLKSCSMSHLPFNCCRVYKNREAADTKVAELCICAGQELVDTVLHEMTTNIKSEDTTEVTKILQSIEILYGVRLSLSKRVLGKTWPITRYLKRPTIDDIVPENEISYIERCVSMLNTRTTVIVASPNTSFLLVIDDVTHSANKTSDTNSAHCTSKADLLNHPIRNAIEKAMKHATDIDNAYLLTGYDIFSLEEPCIFCSMCLLHARVRRVFYSIPMDHNGGLNKHLMIPSLPGVNHRFPVIKFSWI